MCNSRWLSAQRASASGRVGEWDGAELERAAADLGHLELSSGGGWARVD